MWAYKISNLQNSFEDWGLYDNEMNDEPIWKLSSVTGNQLPIETSHPVSSKYSSVFEDWRHSNPHSSNPF